MNTKNHYLWRLSINTSARSWLIIILFHFSLLTFSQTTNISGIINSYHSILGIDATRNGVKLDNVSGLAYGNTVLLIQMKGAEINTSNSSSFGAINSLHEAGNYELATICSVSNDSVFFFNTILNTYDVNSKVQLVKFGEYYSANVIDTIKAQSWNNSTGKGGVLAIKVEEDLTLNAPLFADSAGYNGGSFVMSNSTCNSFTSGWIYDGNFASPQSGAFKGEGVATVSSANSGGRGAPANGGGGGNNHNNGGGGGANLAAGGDGGGNYTTVIGACTGDYSGVAGRALSSAAGTKIFAGGGGGAGHVNNNTPTHGGGDGGGIIIVLAKNIIGNGYKITANGRVGGSGGSDGASGGGAGGTIIMNILNSYSGSLTIEAKGGNGGNADNQNITNRCYGAGGGGSGGVIYFNGSAPAITTSVAAGSAGLDLRVVGCGTPAPATNGTNGSTITNYSYQTSTTASSGCTVSLPIRIIYFEAKLINEKIKLEFDIADPEEANSFTIEKLDAFNKWISIANINANATIHHYESIDNNPVKGQNIYRLKINCKNNSIIYSVQEKVLIKFDNPFIVYPNPAHDRIVIKGPISQNSLIRVTDITGREIKRSVTTTSLSSYEVLLPLIDPGIYLLHVNNYIEKILVLH